MPTEKTPARKRKYIVCRLAASMTQRNPPDDWLATCCRYSTAACTPPGELAATWNAWVRWRARPSHCSGPTCAGVVPATNVGRTAARLGTTSPRRCRATWR